MKYLRLPIQIQIESKPFWKLWGDWLTNYSPRHMHFSAFPSLFSFDDIQKESKSIIAEFQSNGRNVENPNSFLLWHLPSDLQRKKTVNKRI